MHRHSVSVLAAVPFVLATATTAAIKKIPYPEVKVRVEEYKSDDALTAMRKSFSETVSKKDMLPCSLWSGRPSYGPKARL
jgi:hypothetical protein